MKISGKNPGPSSIIITPYLSQFGIQGVIFSYLHKIFENLDRLRLLNAAPFSIVFSTIILIYVRILPSIFCIALFITVVLSPWMMPIAKNLYWMPVFWLLPALFTSLYYLSIIQLHKILLIIAIYFFSQLNVLLGMNIYLLLFFFHLHRLSIGSLILIRITTVYARQ